MLFLGLGLTSQQVIVNMPAREGRGAFLNRFTSMAPNSQLHMHSQEFSVPSMSGTGDIDLGSDPRLGLASTGGDVLGLIYKSLKSDLETRRISAFAKRLLQVECIILLSLHVVPCCYSRRFLKQDPLFVLQAEENEDKIEHFEDAKDADSALVEKAEDQGPAKPSTAEDVWPKRVFMTLNIGIPCIGANIVYNGDPLRDLALGVFLDRFTEKKPKALKANQAGTWHGSSIMLPSKMGPLSSRPVGEEFSSLTEDQVAPEDLVFHKFYVTKSTVGSRKQKKKKTNDDEDDITGGLLGNEAIDGDDSEDEEVDVLLEKEADLEMDGEGDSDEEDEEEEAESEDEIKLDDKDDGDGSEVDEEYDDSEDEEADALLEGGLEMSSGEDDDDDIDMASEDGSLDTIEPIKPPKNSKVKKVIPSKGKKPNKLDTPSKANKNSKLKDGKLGSKKASKTIKLLTGKPGKRSVFQEAESDDDF